MPRLAARFPALLLVLLITALLTQTGCDVADPAALARHHLDSSRAYLAQGQYRAAIIEARNAIRQQPDDPGGHLLLAGLYNQLGHPRQALEVLDQAASSPEPDLALERAEAQLQLQRHRSAHDTLADIFDQVEGQRGHRWQRLQALALAGSGELNIARQLLLELLETSEAARAQIELARLELAAGKPDEATELLQSLEPEQTEYAEAQQLLGFAAFQQGRLDEAEAHLTRALSALPPTDVPLPLKVTLLRQLAQTLTRQGRSSDALAYQRLLSEAAPEQGGPRQALNDALEWYRAGHLDEAEALLARLYENHPGDRQSGLLLGLTRYHQGDPTAAGQLFDRHLDPEAHPPELLEAAAHSRLLTHRAQEALELLEQALADHPDHSGLLAIYGMAALHFSDRREDGALALQRALALAPERSLLRLPLARHFLQVDKPAQALAQLQAAAVEAPADPRLQSAYISLLLTQHRPDQARRAVQRYLAASDQSVPARVLQGEIEMYLGEYEAARDLLDQALQSDPGSLPANEARARLALRQQQWDLAADHFYRAVQLDPGSERACQGLVTAYEAQGNGHQVDAMLRELALHPEHAVTAHSVRADHALRQGRLQEARRALNRALSHGPPSPYAARVGVHIHRAEARIAQDAGDSHRARDQLLAALELVPADPGALSDLVVVEAASGRRDEARRMIQFIRQQPEGDTTATLLTAWLQQRQGDTEAARHTLEEAWQQRAEPLIAERLHPLLTALDDPQAAQMLAQDWHQRLPRDHRPLVLLAASAREARSPRRAQRLYEEALSLAPDDPSLLLQLAELYLELGQPGAGGLARRAMELVPDHADTVSASGWILAQGGEREEGLALLERAALMAPESAAITERLHQARQSGGASP